ncbi:MAG: response regulator [Bacteroidota bacterium]
MESSILVVDDEPTLRLTTKARLQAKGFEVDVAEDGEIALDKLRSKTFDIVLLDINMPRLNGLQTLEAITRDYPHTDVVMLTSFADFSLAIECLKKGAKDYLVKPIDAQELVTRLTALLRAQISERTLETYKEFWRSTILFDVFSHLNSINTILEYSKKAFGEIKRTDDEKLMGSAQELMDGVIGILKGSVQLGELAEGTLLTQQNETMLNVVVHASVERFRPVADRANLKIVVVSPPELPMVKCDVDRVRQVIRSILEVTTWQAWKGEHATVRVEERTKGLTNRDGRFVGISFDYPSGRLISPEILKVVNANEMEWKTLKDSVSIGAFNLAIGKRVIEAHGGEFLIEASSDRTVVRFTLPV